MSSDRAPSIPRPGRRATIKDVAAAAGVALVTVSRVVNMPDRVQADTRQRVLEAMRQLGCSPSDGTRLLRAVFQGLRRFGQTVPQDRSVIGIDTEEAASLTTPETTSIVRDFGAVGRAAADLMLHRLADRASPLQQRMLDSRLLLAGSCAAPPPGRGY